MGTPRAVERSRRRNSPPVKRNAAAINHNDRQHAQGGKEETVEHHVLDTHLVERQLPQ